MESDDRLEKITDYIINHLRKPDIGPLAGFRGDGSAVGRGPANPKQLEASKRMLRRYIWENQ